MPEPVEAEVARPLRAVSEPTEPPETRRRGRLPSAASGGIFVLVAVFYAAAALYDPRVLSSTNIHTILQIATPLALLGLGQTLVLLAGEIDLSVGSTVSLSAAIVATYMGFNDARIVPVALLALAVGGLVGAINGWLVAYLRIPSFVATLGSMLAVSGATLVWTQGAPASNFAPSWRELSYASVGAVPTATLAWLVGGALVAYVVAHRSAWGRSLVLSGSNKRASALAGLPVRRTVWSAYVGCGVFAAAAAIYLTATTGSAQAGIGNGRELDSIAACVLGGVSLFGGRGHVFSTVGGALLLAGIFNFLVLVGAPFELQEVITGTVVIVAVLAYLRLTRSR